MLSVTRVEYSTRKCKRVGIGAVRNPHAPLHFGSSDGGSVRFHSINNLHNDFVL